MSRYRNQNQITTLVIHCADTPNGKYFDARDIDAWHKERSFKRSPELIGYHMPHLHHIGYHFVIRTTGALDNGRKLTETGAHVGGHNSYTIGTCLIGRDKYTHQQWHMLKAHVEAIKRAIPTLKHIKGHREFDAGKTCPGFDVQAWLAGGMEPLEGHILEQGEN